MTFPETLTLFATVVGAIALALKARRRRALRKQGDAA